MSHCYPCSGSGWYVSSSYLSASAEWPHLTGPFGAQDDAKLYAECMIVSASNDTMINFINVFEHKNSIAEDARHFFDCLANDGWEDEDVDIFLQLVADPSGSAIVTLLSDSLGCRQSALALDPCTPANCDTIQTLQQLAADKVTDALVMLDQVFDA